VVVLAALSASGRKAWQNARSVAGVFVLLLLCGCAGLFPQTATLRDTLPRDALGLAAGGQDEDGGPT